METCNLEDAFVNAPVTNLAKSPAFYEAIGTKSNAQFWDDRPACMVFSDNCPSGHSGWFRRAVHPENSLQSTEGTSAAHGL
jgi:hypothetical protein